MYVCVRAYVRSPVVWSSSTICCCGRYALVSVWWPWLMHACRYVYAYVYAYVELMYAPRTHIYSIHPPTNTLLFVSYQPITRQA